MDTVISLRQQPVHRRINPAAPEYQPQPNESFVIATENEMRLIQWFRQLTEADQNMYREEIATVGLRTMQERKRTSRRDAARKAAV